MYDIFQARDIRYNLISQTDFGGYCVNTNRFGLNSLKFFAAKVWDIVPLEIKNSDSVEVFKSKIRKWKPNCSCYLCKTYINNIGFVETVWKYFALVYFVKVTIFYDFYWWGVNSLYYIWLCKTSFCMNKRIIIIVIILLEKLTDFLYRLT